MMLQIVASLTSIIDDKAKAKTRYHDRPMIIIIFLLCFFQDKAKNIFYGISYKIFEDFALQVGSSN